MKYQEDRILILGTGQLGSAFAKALPRAIHWGRSDFDFLNIEKDLKKIVALSPELIINTVAYTAVDRAEDEVDLAVKINGKAISILANYAKASEVPVIHFSTDYIYSGLSNVFQKETDAPAPMNEYGKSKLIGDRALQESGAPFWNFRVSWVFSADGNNFLKTMIKLFKDREVISVVADQVGSPTSADGIVRAVLSAIERNLPFGLYNLRSKQVMSWYEFAVLIKEAALKCGMELKIKEIKAITSADYPTKAKRPLNSRMDVSLLEKYCEMPDLVVDVSETIARLKG